MRRVLSHRAVLCVAFVATTSSFAQVPQQATSPHQINPQSQPITPPQGGGGNGGGGNGTHSLSWSSPDGNPAYVSRGGQNDGFGAAIWNNELWIAWFDASSNLHLQYQDPTNLNGNGSEPQLYGSTATFGVGDANSVKPALAVDGNDNLVISYIIGGKLMYLSTSNGTSILSNQTPCNNATATFSPSLVHGIDGYMYIFFAQASDNTLSVCKILSTGSTFTNIPGIAVGSAPSAVTFDQSYYVFYKSNNSSNLLYLAQGTSPTALQFSSAPQQNHTSTAPSAAVYYNTLYVGFRQNDPNSHSFFYTQSTDGANYSSPILVNWSMGGPPMLVPYLNEYIINIFRQNDYGSYLFEATSN